MTWEEGTYISARWMAEGRCRDCGGKKSRGAQRCWACHLKCKNSNPIPYRQRCHIKAKRCLQSKQWARDNIASVLLTKARKRARTLNIECSICKDDIKVPTICPALGIKLEVSDGRVGDSSPSIDRVNPGKGYVPGNIVVISHRANRIKNNATAEELNQIAQWINTIIKSN